MGDGVGVLEMDLTKFYSPLRAKPWGPWRFRARQQKHISSPGYWCSDFRKYLYPITTTMPSASERKALLEGGLYPAPVIPARIHSFLWNPPATLSLFLWNRAIPRNGNRNGQKWNPVEWVD